jgi:DNA polymerase eta
MRIVGHIDMDAFYVAVERSRDSSLDGKPCAVVQYNTQRPIPRRADENRRTTAASGCGGIIAVSYEARAQGVKRSMNAAEAQKCCPEIILVQVPCKHSKADLAIYKQAGDSVVKVLSRRASACEKRSVDEVAIDITEESAVLLKERNFSTELIPQARACTHLAGISVLSMAAARIGGNDVRRGHSGQSAEGNEAAADGSAEAKHEDAMWARPRELWSEQEQLLMAGAVVVAQLRAAVTRELKFTCSAGISANKLLAKLCCGLHKPNQQTLLFPGAVRSLLDPLPLERLTGAHLNSKPKCIQTDILSSLAFFSHPIRTSYTQALAHSVVVA